jgi:RNA:NAD 2'-phosphotransferase (TPT1/KptA family)
MPGKDRRPRSQGQGQSRDVQVSKALSLLLRHAAEKEGLKMNEQGYASVTDVVCFITPRIITLRYTHRHQAGMEET